MTIPIPPNGSKVGTNNNVDTSSFAVLSNATVVDPSGEQCRIISTSSSDTSAGIGAQKVRIVYFDTNWDLQEEIVTMNGTTQVLTNATNILRIESFENAQIGIAQFTVGTITLTSTDTTKLFAQIDAGHTVFERALHFVSPGKIANIIDIVADCPTSGGVEFVIFRDIDNTSKGGGIVAIGDTSFTLTGNALAISYNIPIICDATTSTQGLRIGIVVIGKSASQIGTASFHFTEV